MIKQTKISVIFLFLSLNLYSHYCDHTYKFIDSLEEYSFVGMVKYIGNDTILINSTSYYSSIDLKYRITAVVEILHQYKGNYKKNTIRIFNEEILGYYEPLRFQNPNDTLVIKAHSHNMIERFDLPLTSIYNEEKILSLSICSENQLKLSNGQINGWITKNKNHNSYKRRKFLHKLTFGLLNPKQSNNKPLQSWNIRKFQQKIYRRLNKNSEI